MSGTETQVFLACQPICLAGLSRVIHAAGLELIGTSDGTEDVVPAIRQSRAEVAVLDVSRAGVVVERVLGELGTGTPVRVVFGSHSPTGAEALQAIELGAAGFLALDSSLGDLQRDLARTRWEATTVSARFEHLVIEELRERGVHADDKALTPRQATIIGLVADGLSTSQIAEQLSLSPLTVKAHYAGINENLGVSSKAAAVAAAFRRGILV